MFQVLQKYDKIKEINSPISQEFLLKRSCTVVRWKSVWCSVSEASMKKILSQLREGRSPSLDGPCLNKPQMKPGCWSDTELLTCARDASAGPQKCQTVQCLVDFKGYFKTSVVTVVRFCCCQTLYCWTDSPCCTIDSPRSFVTGFSCPPLKGLHVESLKSKFCYSFFLSFHTFQTKERT